MSTTRPWRTPQSIWIRTKCSKNLGAISKKTAESKPIKNSNQSILKEAINKKNCSSDPKIGNLKRTEIHDCHRRRCWPRSLVRRGNSNLSRSMSRTSKYGLIKGIERRGKYAPSRVAVSMRTVRTRSREGRTWTSSRATENKPTNPLTRNLEART